MIVIIRGFTDEFTILIIVNSYILLYYITIDLSLSLSLYIIIFVTIAIVVIVVIIAFIVIIYMMFIEHNLLIKNIEVAM